jgi:hypothetical protein
MSEELELCRESTRAIFAREGIGRPPRRGDDVVSSRAWKSLVAAGLADLGRQPDRALAAAVIREASGQPDRTPLAESTLAQWLCPDAPEGVGVVPDGAGHARYGRFGDFAVVGGQPISEFSVVVEAPDSAGEPIDTLSVVGNEPTLNEAGALMRSIQILGATDRMVELCVQYSQDRRQFGRQIKDFQLVRRLLAEVATERAILEAAVELAISRPSRTAVAAAKVCAGESGALACAAAHQLHGAIGTTEEHLLGTLSRRVLAWRDDFGHERAWAIELGTAALAGDGAILDGVG